ncbi:fibulin-2-like [Dendronephthya gigantea]|uniref:fibulin-2-like n=1 Tax=Dendronephthya gigantea TaxID=151771 RepID=UPI001068DFA5|nr:fibulin-2-like [Dendronephthya gigantea]XP_028400189.1 fibulin-2-like [Dendronephthya gigantea]
MSSCSQILLSLACFTVVTVHISFFVEGVDECKTGLKSCPYYSDCMDTDLNMNGTATCSCKKGFTGNGTVCYDINECENKTHEACPGEGFQCENIHGGFKCFCKRNYVNVNNTCVAVDDCIQREICHKDAKCIVTGGNFSCMCKSGYSGDGTYNCTDINECEGSHGCHSNSFCENTPGSYECFCKLKVARGESCEGNPGCPTSKPMPIPSTTAQTRPVPNPSTTAQTRPVSTQSVTNPDGQKGDCKVDDDDNDDTVIVLVAVTIALLALCLIALIAVIICVYRMKKEQ